jgi:hypothetical protein
MPDRAGWKGRLILLRELLLAYLLAWGLLVLTFDLTLVRSILLLIFLPLGAALVWGFCQAGRCRPLD